MNKYENGKIYKLVDENDLWYIGSTTETLNRRLSNHTNGNMNCSSSIMVNPQIYLIEEYPCSNVMELRMREQHYLAKYRDKCINKYNAYCTTEHHKEKKKAWRKQKVECECGSIIVKSDVSRHKKTKKHLNYLQNKNES